MGSPGKKKGDEAWENYVIGVVSELGKAGVAVDNFDAFVVTNVPPGAGVSSSAAVELATAKLLSGLFPKSVGAKTTLDLVKICKAAENNFVGMGCGILDQFSSGFGRTGQLIYLDCRKIQHAYVPFPKGQFVLANTHSPHQLVDGKYEELRKHCFAACDRLKDITGKMEQMTHLRDVTKDEWDQHKETLSERQKGVASHIVNENERVLRVIEHLYRGDLHALGDAMNDSHASSRDDFGNSCHQLDVMQELGKRYKAKTNIEPSMFACKCGEGAFCESVD